MSTAVVLLQPHRQFQLEVGFQVTIRASNAGPRLRLHAQNEQTLPALTTGKQLPDSGVLTRSTTYYNAATPSL